jgi:hypothetical protein
VPARVSDVCVEAWRLSGNLDSDVDCFSAPHPALRAGWLVLSKPETTVDVEAADPQRVLDTRSGVGGSTERLDAGQVLQVQVIGVGISDVPAGASAVVLNLTSTQSEAPGYVTVWPCGQQRPDTSNLNFRPDIDVANLVIAKPGVDGKVCVFASQATHLIADLSGWFPAGA